MDTTDPKDHRCAQCGSTADVQGRLCGTHRRSIARRMEAERWARHARV